jgi:hypothetical protein
LNRQAYERIQLAAANAALVDDKNKKEDTERFTAAKQKKKGLGEWMVARPNSVTGSAGIKEQQAVTQSL